MDSTLRRALRTDDPVMALVWSQRAGVPSSDLSLWARAFDRLLARSWPEAGSTRARRVAALIEVECGSYPCFCSTMADENCPTHGLEVAEGSTRGMRFANWILADATDSEGFSAKKEAIAVASSAIARIVRRLAQES